MAGNKADEAFDQFLDFIAFFCTELVGGASPEYALGRAVQYYASRTPVPFNEALDSIVHGTASFVAAWKRVVQSYHESSESRLVELLGRFLDTDAVTGGARMLRVVQQVRKNTSLTKNRKNLVDAQRSKVLVLSVVSSAIFGMIAAIAPILTPAFAVLGLANQQEPLSAVLHTCGALYLTAIVFTYRLSQATRSSTRTLLLCSLSFFLTFALIANLLTALP